MRLDKIIGVHSSINGSFCIDCFRAMVKYEVIEEINRVASFNVWDMVQETYTISGYDTQLKRFVGDVVEVVRDDSEDVDRQNMDDYPQGLICKSKGCSKIIVSRWQDDSNLIHFANGVTEYGLVYKIGNGPIDALYVAKDDNGNEVIVTDVMSGTDDYYEIDGVFEEKAIIVVNSYITISEDVYIHDRDSFYILSPSSQEQVKVINSENGWIPQN